MLPQITTDHHCKSHKEQMMPKRFGQGHQPQPVIQAAEHIWSDSSEENCCWAKGIEEWSVLSNALIERMTYIIHCKSSHLKSIHLQYQQVELLQLAIPEQTCDAEGKQCCPKRTSLLDDTAYTQLQLLEHIPESSCWPYMRLCWQDLGRTQSQVQCTPQAWRPVHPWRLWWGM